MPNEIGVFVVHGMGMQQDARFADGFIAEVSKRLRKAGLEGAVVWETGYWADLLNAREQELWRLVGGERLDFRYVRRFLINYFADAVAYGRQPDARDDVYRQVHRRIRDCLGKLRAKLGGEDRPIVVAAHSLGSVMMSNYIWDEQHPREDRDVGRNALERMETLAGIITFGSNIPLFTLALDEIVAIEFPPRTIPEWLRPHARWYNYYDRDDVLGYPLRGLSESYARAVVADREINVGNPLFQSWNPISHGEYWTDDSFTRPVAAHLADLAAAVRRGRPDVPVVA